MHLFNSEKEVPHPDRVFPVLWFACTKVKPDPGQAEQFLAPGEAQSSAKGSYPSVRGGPGLPFPSKSSMAGSAVGLSLRCPLGCLPPAGSTREAHVQQSLSATTGPAEP